MSTFLPSAEIAARAADFDRAIEREGRVSPREGITLCYVCPRCGRKLSKVAAMACATVNIRRKCGGCGRHYSLTIQPIGVATGWLHSALICEMEPNITVIE